MASSKCSINARYCYPGFLLGVRTLVVILPSIPVIQTSVLLILVKRSLGLGTNIYIDGERDRDYASLFGRQKLKEKVSENKGTV